MVDWVGFSRELFQDECPGSGCGAFPPSSSANLLRGGPWQQAPRTTPGLIGHLGQMRDSEEGLLDVDRLVRTHGHSCSWFLGPFYHLVRVFHPDFNQSPPQGRGIHHSQSLLLSNGEEWSRRRRLLTPAFHFDVLKGYVAVFNNATHTMHSKWIRLSSEGQRDLEMFQHVGLMTLDSLLRCAFSHSSDCQETPHEFTTAILELGTSSWIGAEGSSITGTGSTGAATRASASGGPPRWCTAALVHGLVSVVRLQLPRRVVEHRRTLIREQSHRESPEGTARDGPPETQLRGRRGRTSLISSFWPRTGRGVA
ncbi:unnamed protein product [Gadus morhua 'NCC']